MSQGASGKVIAALVCGIISLVMGCFPFGIVAIVLGRSEMADIDRGISSPEGEGYAKAAIILGWISVALAILGLLGILCLAVFMGGFGLLTVH